MQIIQEVLMDMLGYQAGDFLAKELNKQLHPFDLPIITKDIYYTNTSFFSTVPPEEFREYVISYNYRIKNATGIYVKVLQRFSIPPFNSLLEPWSMPGTALDISNFKNDSNIVHTIERSTTKDGEVVKELIYKKLYPVTDEYSKFPLSNRELEVLRYLSTGLSSKQIAQLASISINTVNNHRKNMLKKVSCNSSPELISFAGKHGLL